jgi:choline kinase
MGQRLGPAYRARPKCLLEFGGKSLLQRYIEILRHCGIEEIVIGTGYRAECIVDELSAIGEERGVELEYNPRYKQGSVVTVWHLREQLIRGGEVLLMDADMLFDHRLIERVLGSDHENRLLVDRNMEPGEEPVKLCIRGGVPVELTKQVNPDGDYDFCGEMAGLVWLTAAGAAGLSRSAKEYLDRGFTAHDYEELLRQMLRAEIGTFGFEECTHLPWIEIDFAEDIARASEAVLPRLQDIEGREGEAGGAG